MHAHEDPEPPEPFSRAERSAATLRSGLGAHDIAVVLGSGWAGAAEELGRVVGRRSFIELGLEAPGVHGHGSDVSSLEVGDEATPVLVLAGRVHLYEGHRVDAVVHPVRAAVLAGASTVVLTNAAGSLRRDRKVGTVVALSDQLNLTGDNPMCGPAPPPPLPGRFVDLTDLYCAELRGRLRSAGGALPEGVYAGVRGGSFETPAEIRMLRTLGADLVGMSTVLEAIAARHLGARVVGLSLVTNLAAGMQPSVDHVEVLDSAAHARPELVDALREVVAAARELNVTGGRLRFGTAGLRATMGPGPQQMNVATVRRVAEGIASWCWQARRSEAPPLVVVGRDGRRGSADFARALVEVLSGRGCDVACFDREVPTPLAAFAVRPLGATAAVVVTASHNPAGDNGLKVIGPDGAQVAAPDDASIEAWIDEPDRTRRPAGELRQLAVDGELTTEFVSRAVRLAGPIEHPPSVLYTALHGVGAELLEQVLAAAGVARVRAVASQRDPDPDFAGMERPNPEEPAALAQLLGSARDTGVQLALALDPDADRLAVAVPDTAGPPGAPLRVLTGDEVGALLSWFLLSRGSGPDRLVCSTVVSSQLVGRICAAAGVHHVETPTGFKWLVRPALEHPELEQVLCSEEALGYAVGPDARDKDALTAAAVVCALASHLARDGRDLLDALDGLARSHGAFVTRNGSVPVTPALPSSDELGRGWDRSGAVARRAVEEPAPGVVRWWLDDGTRILLRRSGTEPLLKYYCEAVEPVAAGGVGAARSRAAERAGAAAANLVRMISWGADAAG